MSVIPEREELKAVTKAAEDAIVRLMKTDLAGPVNDEKWEELVQLTQSHAQFRELYNFDSEASNWKKTRSKKKKTTRKIVALDCEMCVVGDNVNALDIDRKALARVTVIDGDNLLEDILTDLIVHQPEEGRHVIDYKTYIHGIPAESITQSKISVERAQKEVLKYISKDTIVVGQSLSLDLQTLRISHHRCIDTALIYKRMTTHEKFSTPGLSDFAKHLFEFEMPTGHDSVLDSQVTMMAAIRAAKYGCGEIIPYHGNYEAFLARSSRLRIHRIPKGVNTNDIKNFFTNEANVVPAFIEAIVWSQKKGNTASGSCHAGFLSTDHADLAFKTIQSHGKRKNVSKKQKLEAVESSGPSVKLGEKGEIINDESQINYDLLGRAQKRVKITVNAISHGQKRRQTFYNIQIGAV